MPAVPAIIEAAARVPALCGTKEGHNDLNRWQALHAGTDLTVLPADDFNWIEYYRRGSKGFMTPTIAVYPEAALELHRLLENKSYTEAERYESAFKQLWRAVIGHPELAEYHLVARFKAVCKAAGTFDPGHAGPPIFDLPVARLDLIRSVLADVAKQIKS